ncbi:MFS transporter [Flavobacterium sp.]|uniref:MFS transporter n=1 Tax=Flavobacterium sp. TaxID=239 RepID=UPI003D0F2953
MLDLLKPSSIQFDKEIKIIAVITLINRMGAVVVPFLSKYLKEGFQLDYSHIGWIMMCFGLGSLLGTFLSGKLADRFGAYRIMWLSLLGNGIFFLILMNVQTFANLCIFVFLLTTIADMYRPAMMLLVSEYTSKELKLPSLSLIRTASNFGMVIGPVIGAFIIHSFNYKALFILDGVTCILAALVLILGIKEKKTVFKLKLTQGKQDRLAPLKDFPFLINWVIALITGYLYFQVFSLLPLYQKHQFNLNEIDTGLLFAFSGLLFILFEVRTIHKIQYKKANDALTIAFGLLLFTIAHAILYFLPDKNYLWIFMLLMTFGNMLTFTFASGIVMKRSLKNHEGIYMSAFQMSYGLAHVVSSKMGLSITQRYSFATNWLFNTAIGLIGILFCFLLARILKKEREQIKQKIANVLFR